MAAIAFDAGAAAAALLRLATSHPGLPETAGEEARALFFAWLIGLPAGTERQAACAARPELCGLAGDPVCAALLALVEGMLALPPTRPAGSRRRPRLLH